MTAVTTNFIPLQTNSAGDAEAKGLKVWMGEVAGAYYQSSVTEGLFDFKSVSGGLTEAQWIVTGRRGSVYHTRGADILTDQDAGSTDYVKTLNTAEVTVRIDRPRIAASFLDRQDSILTHFDSQSEMRRQDGQTLARAADDFRLRMLCRGSHRIDGGDSANDLDTFVTGIKPSGSPTALAEATFANYSTDSTGSSTEEAIAAMAEVFDDLEVPGMGRYMFVNPATYHFLISKLDDYIDRDFAGEGSKARAVIYFIHGFRVIKTTNLPDGGVNDQPSGIAGGSSANDYYVNGTGLKAVFGTRDSIAEVRLGGGFGGESAYIPERMGTLVNSYWVGGFSELRPEACGTIYTSVPSNRNVETEV